MLCTIFDHGVPPTTQKREYDTKDVQGGKIQMEEPDGTEDGKNLLYIG